jgi:Glyoxalase-like domain
VLRQPREVGVTVTDDRATSPTTGVTVGWVAVDCADPPALASWWQRLLGGEVTVDDDGDVLLDAGPVPLLFMRVPEAKSVKNRLHLDLRVTDYDGAMARALALGGDARR